MKSARCYCVDCDREYTVTFEDYTPRFSLKCILCSSPKLEVTWVGLRKKDELPRV
jgi:hypothetical protein